MGVFSLGEMVDEVLPYDRMVVGSWKRNNN